MVINQAVAIQPTDVDKLASCEQTLNSCATAVDTLLEVTKRSTDLITNLKDGVASRDLKIEDLEAANHAWYKNPTIMIPLGVVIGGATVLLIRK